ncbi:MAG: asparagine synthase-related protein [Vicinamibacterales bacterium]|nr:asparagine synthase-related protein [Vicinamibacterales bacterium]
MNGIAGAWNLDRRPMARDAVAAMSGRLRHRGRDGEAMRIEGAVGFACQHSWVTPEEHGEHQPLAIEHAGQSAMLVMDGRLDNRAELIGALGLHASLSDARLVLAAYEAFDEGFAERLSGDFALAIFDSRRQRLVLARDAIGVRPLYYFHSRSFCAFASEIKGLLAHPEITAHPDDEGVADFMLVGSRPLDHQDLTCFKGISSVVPAHLVIVTPERLTRRRYWDFDTHTALRLRSFDEYVDAFRERFAEAVKRRTRSRYPVAVSVSGGLDSSSIFCEAETLRRSGAVPVPGVRGISYVSNRRETDEQHYLRDIEAQFGVSFDRFPIEPLIGLVDGAEAQITAIEAPFVDYMWGVTRELHTRAAATGARSMLSGHWGDQMLFSSAYLIDLLRRGAVSTIWRHTREYARYFGSQEASRRRRLLLVDAVRYHVPRSIAPPLKWLRLQLLDRRRTKDWFAAAFLKSALRHRYRLATFERAFHSAHAQAVYIEARSKYQVQCMEWNAKVGALHGLDLAYPFLDRDLIAFIMSIPGDVHAYNGVPRALLREGMRGVLPDSIRARTWKSDFSPFVNMGLSHDAAVILQTLTPDCLGVRFGYLDAERLAPELARLAAGLNAADCVNSWNLGDTYGLEMWLRVFWKNEAKAQGSVATEAPLSHA